MSDEGTSDNILVSLRCHIALFALLSDSDLFCPEKIDAKKTAEGRKDGKKE
jgi:hypothetical protein